MIYYNKRSKIDDIKIKIYDVMGNMIATDQDVTMTGRNQLFFDSDLAL